MRKIICDRCGKVCEHSTAGLSLSRAEFTSTGEQVGYDDFEGQDLCDICTEVARTEWGFKVNQGMYKPDIEQVEYTSPQDTPPGYMVVPGGCGHHTA
jgi:hypothetical protein